MGYKMLFTDLDATLLNNNREISKENMEAIFAAKKAGVIVVACTGRGIFGVGKIMEQLEMDKTDGYVICLNGSTLYNSRTKVLVEEKTMSPEIYKEIIKTAHKQKIAIQAYRDHCFMVENLDNERVRDYISILSPAVTIIKDMSVLDIPLNKILLNGEHEQLLKIRESFKSKYENELSIVFSNPNFLEFTDINATKGVAMLSLARRFNINAEDILAVGDNLNDVEMIKKAGLGVAVKNAEPQLKEAADYVCEKTNDENAISEVINKFIFS